ncbi:MAG: hypothetical protein Q8O70_08110 [Burkholderiales bacterium]|nr:hypothetical protein [Burkholderiales bacterium]
MRNKKLLIAAAGLLCVAAGANAQNFLTPNLSAAIGTNGLPANKRAMA